MISYMNSTMKVLCDKTYDYINYYIGNIAIKNSSDEMGDSILDYKDVINVELYENEDQSMRIYPPSGIYNEYSTFWGNATKVVDNIYLGSAFNAASYSTLKKLNIKVILNATTEISNYFESDFIYLRYELYDNNKNRIRGYLEKSFNDIRYHQENTDGNILIHCFMGASRSASIVLYYLMRTQFNDDGSRYTFDDAMAFLKNKRLIVNPTFRLTKDLANSVTQSIN